MQALLAGASGLVGSQLLELLAEDNDYSKIVLLVRKKLNISDPRIVQVQTDFGNLKSVEEFFDSIDIVFCCLGTTMKKSKSQEAFMKVDFEIPLEIARLAIANNVHSYFAVTAMGADPSARIFYNRVKGKLEAEVRKLKFKCSKFFRPSLLFGKRNELRPAERLAIILFRIFDFFMVGPLSNYRGIPAKKVAYSMWKHSKIPSAGTSVIYSGQMQNTE